MKDYSYHKKVIDDVITKLNESDIDLYLLSQQRAAIR